MTDVPDPAVDATGLQAERTQLAWVRTALAAAALAAIAARLTASGPSLVLAGTFGLAVALPGATAAWARIRTLARQPTPGPAAPWTVALLATSLVLADVLALALLVT